ncbi:hypothetical protein AB4305_30615 [Nocardia sp. 2YAB30]|uniref:hypothetical protein n=1 Tax=Nocardia sp. 2YAB30 TaxID=3233022 RepID=UPI003F997FF7
MSTVSALQAALDVIDSLIFDSHAPPLRSTGLPRAIEIALMPPSPGGSPTSITERAGDYRAASKACSRSSTDLTFVAKRSLPTAWRGAAAETAAQAIEALAAQSQAADDAFRGGADVLRVFAEKLARAQKADKRGIELLQKAEAMALSLSGRLGTQWFQIRHMAAQGCHQRLTAAKLRDDAATDVVSGLKQFAAQARARQIDSPGIDPLSTVVLAYVADFGWDRDPLRDILTPTALARASQLLNNMSEADRKKFEEMLGAARSPQEAAYIWKALAAGYSLADVQSFDKVVHPHGNDSVWLSVHLNPRVDRVYSDLGKQGKLGYKGQFSYGQDKGDCVASATIVARADNDPVFMLGLTTGQGPAAVAGAAPGNDSPTAFRDRLVHVYGATDATLHNTPEGRGELFTTALRPSTGDTYTVTSVHGASPSERAAERQAMLPEIETAVNAGKPVPITVAPDPGVKGGAHELVVMAARGDKLEIYNPWGYTEWVTKQQFIDGELGAVTESDPKKGMSDITDAGVPR